MLFLWLVLLQVIIFGVLILFLRLIFSRNVSHATAHLSELNEDFTAKLDEAKKRQNEADKYYDETLLKAKNDAEKMKMQILKEARESQTVILESSRKQSEDILAQANNARESLIKEIEQKIDMRSVIKAGELLEKVLPEMISKEMHERWTDDLLEHGLQELERLNLSADVKEARVLSAYPLSAEQKALLQKKLKDAAKREIKLTMEVDPKLVAGIRMTLGSVLVDGSLTLKIKEIARHANSVHSR